MNRCCRAITSISIVASVFLLMAAGCSKSETADPKNSSASDSASTTDESARRLAQSQGPPPIQDPDQGNFDLSREPVGPTGGLPNLPTDGSVKTVETIPAPEVRTLSKNLTADQLVEFLGAADRDMREVAMGRAGITDVNKIRVKLRELAKLKLEASQKLKNDPSIPAKQQIEGARGELQALSHLASMNDVRSAEKLEKLAAQNLRSSDEGLVGDSRMVLIGFAIENLQNRKEGAAAEITELIDDLAKMSNLDISALLVMGQARQVLATANFPDEAKQIRQHIIDLFANSSDRAIADTAAQLAGSVNYDETEKLLRMVLNNEDVSAERWQESARELISKSSDLMTVKYLAGAAVEFEGVGKDALASVTYDVLAEEFPDKGDATSAEVRIAVKARQARKDILGEHFDPELGSVDGKPLAMTDFAGKIVLMPFWAQGFPESMQVIPVLKKLQEEYPGKIEIVGMNLDPANTKFDPYLQDELGFRSFRSVDAEVATASNPVAEKFGVVSMPYVAIINQNSDIEAIDFTGRKLGATVKQLLSQ